MDSYFAEVVINENSYYTVEPFARPFTADARAAVRERRSAETQGLWMVTQADMPLSYIPFPDVQQEHHPTKDPAEPVITDELGSFTPRRYCSLGRNNARGGENAVDQDSLDATNLNHHL